MFHVNHSSISSFFSLFFFLHRGCDAEDFLRGNGHDSDNLFVLS